jgi:hypothetical protein
MVFSGPKNKTGAEQFHRQIPEIAMPSINIVDAIVYILAGEDTGVINPGLPPPTPRSGIWTVTTSMRYR